jgi:hypothetical protein
LVGGGRRVHGPEPTALSAIQNAKRSPESGDLLLQIAMVAGACNGRYLQLWSGAA